MPSGPIIYQIRGRPLPQIGLVPSIFDPTPTIDLLLASLEKSAKKSTNLLVFCQNRKDYGFFHARNSKKWRKLVSLAISDQNIPRFRISSASHFNFCISRIKSKSSKPSRSVHSGFCVWVMADYDIKNTDIKIYL